MRPDGATGLLTSNHEAQAQRTHDGPSSHERVLGERKRRPRPEKKFVLGSTVCPCNDKLPPEKRYHIGERDPRSEIRVQDEKCPWIWWFYRGCMGHAEKLREKWLKKPQEKRAAAACRATSKLSESILNIRIGAGTSRTHGKARRAIPVRD